MIPNWLHQPSLVGRKRQKGLWCEQGRLAESTWRGDGGQKQLVTLGTNLSFSLYPSPSRSRGSQEWAVSWSQEMLCHGHYSVSSSGVTISSPEAQRSVRSSLMSRGVFTRKNSHRNWPLVFFHPLLDKKAASPCCCELTIGAQHKGHAYIPELLCKPTQFPALLCTVSSFPSPHFMSLRSYSCSDSQ